MQQANVFILPLNTGEALVKISSPIRTYTRRYDSTRMAATEARRLGLISKQWEAVLHAPVVHTCDTICENLDEEVLLSAGYSQI